jgi:hypothetical protein
MLQNNHLKRYYTFAIIFLFTAITFTQCKKESSSTTPGQPAENPTLTRVKTLLDQQMSKFGDSSLARATVMSVKENLIGAEMREEAFGQKKLIIVPLKNEFKTANLSKQRSFKNLIVTEEEDGSLRTSSLIEIFPKDQQFAKVPAGLISKTYTGEENGLNGIVSLMSVTNHIASEIEYKAGKIASTKYLIKKKGNEKEGEKTNSCIDWYWEYWVDGVKVYEEFAFSTCSPGGDECQATRTMDAATPFRVECGGGNGNGQGQPEQEITNQYGFNSDEADPEEGVAAPLIHYYHPYTMALLKPSNQIVNVWMYPTTAQPVISSWVDSYGRSIQRTITLYGHAYSYTFLSPTSVMLNWFCYVGGHYVYSDGTTKMRVWTHTYSAVQ